MRIPARVTIFLAVVFLPLPPLRAAAGAREIRVAAAANLTYALQTLDAAFVREKPGRTVTPVFGASGSLVAQIENGAPFDVFLAADRDFAQRLIRMGAADGPTLETFALGKLVLWTTKAGVDLSSIRAVVGSPDVRRLAIANPRTAPFGRAARQVLEKLKLEAAAEPKLVVGENIAQTAEYVQTGNADAGFVALSLLIAPGHPMPGRWVAVEPGLYASLPEAAVLTRRGTRRAEARDYLAFLVSPAARKILARYGYGLPPSGGS